MGVMPRPADRRTLHDFLGYDPENPDPDNPFAIDVAPPGTSVAEVETRLNLLKRREPGRLAVVLHRAQESGAWMVTLALSSALWLRYRGPG